MNTVKYDLEKSIKKKERTELLETHMDLIDFKIGQNTYIS